jgi:hypothetical protein
MKQINHRIFIAAVVVGGLFVGAVKGQEARSRWMSKMKIREESRKTKPEYSNEIFLYDFEFASFQNN